jgi:hypothetical protein
MAISFVYLHNSLAANGLVADNKGMATATGQVAMLAGLKMSTSTFARLGSCVHGLYALYARDTSKGATEHETDTSRLIERIFFLLFPFPFTLLSRGIGSLLQVSTT